MFRDLDSNPLIGMASDRYAGWIGQIYSESRYEKGITRRSHKVGDKTFNEETLPVESVAGYFEHFPLLAIDYTFYRPLLYSNGNPTQNFHVLKSYHLHMRMGISFFSKPSRSLSPGGQKGFFLSYPNLDISIIAYFLSNPRFWTTLLICSDSWRMALSRSSGPR